MENIVDIKNRIKSIKDTAQITKAMQLISVSKLRKVNEVYQHNDRYYRRIKSTIKDIFKRTSWISHPYLEQTDNSKVIFIIVASDAGLAGDYNHRVLSFAEGELAKADAYKIFTVGHMAEEYLSGRGYPTDNRFVYNTQNPTVDDVRRLAATVLDLYDADEAGEVRVIYTRSIGGKNTAISTRVVPIAKADFEDAKSFDDYSETLNFEPSEDEVLNILVPQYVFGTIFYALIESVRCEHNERILAMNNATNNAKDMTERLELEYHRARQARITAELSEISASGKAQQ